MTIETKTSIELKDIQAVEVECRQCHAKQIRNIDAFKNFPVVCGNCETQLIIPGSRNYEQMMLFVRHIGELAQDEGERFTLRLQIKAL
jgi:hypothetical protein